MNDNPIISHSPIPIHSLRETHQSAIGTGRDPLKTSMARRSSEPGSQLRPTPPPGSCKAMDNDGGCHRGTPSYHPSIDGIFPSPTVLGIPHFWKKTQMGDGENPRIGLKNRVMPTIHIAIFDGSMMINSGISGILGSHGPLRAVSKSTIAAPQALCMALLRKCSMGPQVMELQIWRKLSFSI